MNEEKSQVNIIYEIFKNGELHTVKDLNEKTGIPINNIYVYLHQFKKKNIIKLIEKIGNISYFQITSKEERTKPTNESIELLKFLNDFFKENIDLLMTNPKIIEFISKNENKFKQIEEVLS